MKLRYKIPLVLLILLVTAISSLALVVSHDSPCSPIAPANGTASTMKAVLHACYGSPEVLELVETEKPVPGANEILVRVQAASVNPLDWHYMRGSPYIMRLGSGIGAPDDARMGVDFAGTVEEVGKDVKRFTPGDAVFGGRSGAFAEYLVIPEDRAVVRKPENVTFEQAASVPIAAITALQALRDTGQLRAGQSVLINGASGGVGTFAVQIAKAYGAKVSGVCSTRNVQMVRSIGADHVFDYTREDYTESGEQFDLIIDNVGNHSLFKNRKVLRPGGKLIMIGGSKGDWLGPLMRPLSGLILSPFFDEQFVFMLASMKADDLAVLADWLSSGTIVPVIDREYPLSATSQAIAYSEEGHASGKIIIDVN